MISYGEQVNKLLATVPWMQSYISGVASQNAGWFWVNLDRDRHRPNVKLIMADLQKRLRTIPGLNVYLRNRDFVDLGESEGRSQYSAALESPDAGDLYRWARRLKTKLQSMPELLNVSSDLQLAAPRLNVDIRRDLAMSLDVDPEKIANTLYDAYGNRRANTIMVASERYDVILEVANEYQRGRGPATARDRSRWRVLALAIANPLHHSATLSVSASFPTQARQGRWHRELIAARKRLRGLRPA